MNAGRTAWRIVGIDGREGLNITLVVDTTAALVVGAIEEAAEANGIELELVEGDDVDPFVDPVVDPFKAVKWTP